MSVKINEEISCVTLRRVYIGDMKTKYYLVTRKNEVIASVDAHNFEHAVEEMNNKVGTATRRSSDCIMSATEYQPGRTTNNY